MPLNVAISDTYAYSAILRTPSGTLITSIGGEANLQVGTTNLVLNFSGADIFSSGQNGPHVVVDLVVKERASQQVLFYVRSVGQTAAYQSTQFIPCNPLVVNSSSDNPTIGGCITTLRQAVQSAGQSGGTVEFELAPNSRQITLTAALLIPLNVSLQASCTARVRINATTSNLLQLSGNNTLQGLEIYTLQGPAVKTNGTGNRLICTKTQIGAGP